MNYVHPIKDPEVVADIKAFLKENNKRNFMMFLLGVDTGLRICDILKLRVRDVVGSHIEVKEKKTGKNKRILITKELRKEIKEYVSGMQQHEYLIRSREGYNKPIGRNMAYKIIREVAREFSLQGIGCHSLRKTFGYTFYHLSDKDVGMLQQFFGHSSPKITLRYIGIEQDSLDSLLKRYKSS
ncbi:tyrosine-type recombinase/integrase [Paenibacillus whitsoniae]|uniref:Site-specific integrase n=1 Tax=Paenibacillus whitsoniae TaxID=2496558 RepID=A0A3S0A874_9BACL|nr:tyrosine-type recombinase/integrase [Paenibacillus whitsoniae]RTE05501.1 site-specific integrase [Paenibacillus whitsoniae]